MKAVSFEDSGYRMLRGADTEESDDGWVDDCWTDSESGGSSTSMQIDGADPSPSQLKWDSLLALSRRLFTRNEAAQPPLVGKMLFGAGSQHSTDNNSALDNAMKPFLLKETARGYEAVEEESQTGSDSREGSSALVAPLLNRGGSLQSGMQQEAKQKTWHRQRREIFPSRRENVSSTWKRRFWLGVQEACLPIIRKGLCIEGEPAELRRERGSNDAGSWRHKIMEVLPVLGIVALAVVGAVVYLILVDGVWQKERVQFSIDCQVGAGNWVRSSDPTLYSSSCPYMRDTFNCHKFGLSSSQDYWRWEPDQCILPLFDPHEFLRIMRGKRVAFIGDQSAANSFDSLVCMLAEAETPHLQSKEMESSSAEAEEEGPSPADVQSGQSNSASLSWGSFSEWYFRKANRSPKTEFSEPSVHQELREEAWGSSKMAYLFPMHNFTLLLYDSPLLVKATKDVSVNVTACQLSKAARSSIQAISAKSVSENNTSGASMPAVGVTENRNGSNMETLAAGGHLLRDCYPNRVEVDQPDPLWASEAHLLDVVVLNSGSGWREEAAELQGLGIYKGGERQVGMSVEGLVGEWAYPQAMAEVTHWLANSENFRGTAIFRSFTPAHQRRECAGRMMLPTEEAAIEAVRGNEFDRYEKPIVEALKNTGILYLNVTMMSSKRGDGHPWMSSPSRPKPDCTNWCLPGVPDSWNEILGGMLLDVYGKEHPLKPLIVRQRVSQ